MSQLNSEKLLSVLLYFKHASKHANVTLLLLLNTFTNLDYVFYIFSDTYSVTTCYYSMYVCLMFSQNYGQIWMNI